MPWIPAVFIGGHDQSHEWHGHAVGSTASIGSKASTTMRIYSTFAAEEEGKVEDEGKEAEAAATEEGKNEGKEVAAEEAGPSPTDKPFVPKTFLPWMFGKHKCPCDQFVKFAGPIPECVDKDGDCMDDKAGLEKWAAEIDHNLHSQINEVVKMRDLFQRAACDYKYAQISPDKPMDLESNYGPDGPKALGGSYLYVMHRWRRALDALTRACDKDVEGCRKFLEWTKNHPESVGKHAVLDPATKTKIYKEIKAACHLGKTRSPVPNKGPLWCTGEGETLECEERSCYDWWRRMHKRDPKFVWIDEERAEEYDELKQLCGRIHKDFKGRLSPDKYQEKVKKEETALKDQFCRPRWIHGYCDNNEAAERRGECHMDDGYYCEKGKVLGDSLVNDTANWTEKYPEKLFDESKEGKKGGKKDDEEVKPSWMPPLLLPQELFPPRRRQQHRCVQSFL